ncbi:Uncharacterised protein [Mycoplasmopsis citelli]|uniref:Uncharacterized protein n=1 Tax=Mycoplasmopsis citelli TaxID=171281 RepID=A0A449B1W8_9BACT|nr:hypothetical protein [Mycoplasmopsis citelli]VEU74598.1 Uncharacterised protein [Mycoplasmopsis citelli]
MDFIAWKYLSEFGTIFGISFFNLDIFSGITPRLFSISTKKFDDNLIDLSLAKANFVLENNFNAHPFFIKGIDSFAYLIKKVNFKIILITLWILLPALGVISFLIWASLNQINDFVFGMISWIVSCFSLLIATFLIHLIIKRYLKIKKIKNLSKKLVANSKLKLFDFDLEKYSKNLSNKNDHEKFWQENLMETKII